MFGSTNAFGQSSGSPFGSPSVFGQANNTNSNPFTPKPFGSTTPFGSQPGGSIFGGTSTGMFGAPQTSSPFSSTATFGASSAPAFGSSSPAFGAASASSFGGSSVFGQKPAVGGFGSNTPTSPFGSTSQPSQPAFGSGLFGSTTPFGASSQPAFGAANSPGFGTSNAPTFGSSSTPAFGASGTLGFGSSSTPSFGAATTPAFGAAASSAFGTGSAFGASNNPVFGSGGGFGASSAPGFGSSSTPFGAAGSAFGASTASGFGGASSTPAFGASSTPAFGSSSPSFNFGSSPSFGQSTSAFGNTQFGTSVSPFTALSSPFGAQATTPSFGSTGFAGNRGGSRVVAYSATAETDSSGGQPGKLESISAMPAYKDKSHEELRWEDYQLGDKGGQLPPGQSSAGNFSVSGTSSNPFSQPSTFSQTSASPFPSSISSNPFNKPNTTPFSQSPFSQPSSNPFQSTSNFGSTSSSIAPNTTPSIFSSVNTSTFNSAPSMFTSTTPSFGSTEFAGNRGGSRVVAYSATAETDSSGGQPGKLESISAMPAYKDKSHEELRWEDYQLGDKGGQLPPGQSSAGNFSVSGTSSNLFSQPSTFSQTSASPFPSSISSNPFSKPNTTPFSQSPFSQPSSNPFQSTSNFGSTSSSIAPNTTPSIFSSISTSTFNSAPSMFTSTTLSFGSTGFAGNRGGSRVVAYSATAETDSSGGQPGKLESISVMPAYKDKSHEELRWEDYQLGDKGGQLPPGQSSAGNFSVSGTSSNPFSQPSTFSQTSASPFPSSISSNPFNKPNTTPFSQSPFSQPSSNPFQSTSNFGSTSSSIAPNTTPSIFSSVSTSTFNSAPSMFTSTAGQTNTSPFGNFSNTRSSLSFLPNGTSFGQTGSAFGQSATSFAPSTTLSFNQTNMFNTPSTGFAFSSKKLTGASNLRESICDLVDVMKSKSTTTSAPPIERPTIQECLDILHGFPSYSLGAPVRYYASLKFAKKEIREIFMGQPNEEERIGFLQFLYDEKHK